MENSPSIFHPWRRHWPTGAVDESIYFLICLGAIYILSILNGEDKEGIIRSHRVTRELSPLSMIKQNFLEFKDTIRGQDG